MNRRRLISAAAVLLLTAGGVAAGIAPASAAPTPGVNIHFFPEVDGGYSMGYPDGADVDLLAGSYNAKWVAQNASLTETITVHLEVANGGTCDAVLAPGADLDCPLFPIWVPTGSSAPSSVTGTAVTSAGSLPIDAAVTVVGIDSGLSSWVSFLLPDGTNAVVDGGGTISLPVGYRPSYQIGVHATTPTESLGTHYISPEACAGLTPIDVGQDGALVCDSPGPLVTSRVNQMGGGMFTVDAAGTNAVDGSAMTTHDLYTVQAAGACQVAATTLSVGDTQTLTCSGFLPGMSIEALELGTKSAPFLIFPATVGADGTFSVSFIAIEPTIYGNSQLVIRTGYEVLWTSQDFFVNPAAAVVPAGDGTGTGSGRASLAATGAAPTGPAAPLGALALLAGVATLVIARRRRTV
ncbi:hypothetical protein [Herbiconiux solani]|uniref:hypothetical protein n=1 Tax=Herbiconiux solani TaxID=661329 RepID=UPI000825D1F1|nr:hypothetical protein [Herbiconiux solani]